MKRSISFLLIILLGVLPLFAESTWEGTTAVSRYGEFPESGNYGASNSFAMNTAITVKNVENGRETTVFITDRLKDPGLFLLISKNAGKELGIAQGEIVRVRASRAHPEGAITTFPDDLPYNPDPDVNPAASVTPIPQPGEPEEVTETDQIAEADTEEIAVVDEAAEPEEVDQAAEPEEEAAEPEEAAEVEEPVEVAEAPPRINGIDSADRPPEEEPSAEPADEPSPPSVDVPSVLGLDPAPVIDRTESFVLLAEPDVPDTRELVGEPETKEDLRISSLEVPDVAAEAELGVIAPPEPVFEEKIVETVQPVAEDILIVSNLNEPDAVAIASYDVPEVDDEPAVPEVSEETALVLTLDPAEAAAGEAPVDIAAGERDEPTVTDVVPEEDTPIVVNGYAPPDPEEVEIVLEPALPKPPEPRIADSDLLERAEGEEPERDVEIAAVTEPEVAEEPVEAAEEAPPVEAVHYMTELAEEDYYLQLAAFTEARTAARLKADLSETYPVTVYLTETPDRRVYKVLVGPLNQDESGALLYQFRVRGFPDAFVRGAGAVN